MELTGSRSTGTGDEFSDWDYSISGAADFEAMHKAIDGACVWTFTDAGPFRLLTVVDAQGVLHDYSDTTGGLETEWAQIAARQSEPGVHNYWVIAFKHLKAAHRRFYVLLDLGIEMSSGLLRDIYLEKLYGAARYKDFFSFKPLAERIEKDTRLSRITGMAYASLPEKLAKLRAMNTLIAEIAPDAGRAPLPVWEIRAALL